MEQLRKSTSFRAWPSVCPLIHTGHHGDSYQISLLLLQTGQRDHEHNWAILNKIIEGILKGRLISPYS